MPKSKGAMSVYKAAVGHFQSALHSQTENVHQIEKWIPNPTKMDLLFHCLDKKPCFRFCVSGSGTGVSYTRPPMSRVCLDSGVKGGLRH